METKDNSLIEKWEKSGLLEGLNDLQDKLQFCIYCEEILAHLSEINNGNFETAPFLIIRKLFNNNKTLDIRTITNEFYDFVKSDKVKSYLVDSYPNLQYPEEELLNMFIDDYTEKNFK